MQYLLTLPSLGKWTESLNKCAALYGMAGIKFKPCCAITDTDLKERAALTIVFVDIWLLICRFHLRQSWQNHRNKLLKGKSQAFLDLKNHLVRLEKSLMATQEISEAHALLEAEWQLMVELLSEHSRASRKAIEHINYLNTYWTTENLWKSWSLPGGASLLDQRKLVASAVPKIAYLLPDVECDACGLDLVLNRQISAPTAMPGNAGLTLTAFSAQALSIDADPITYNVQALQAQVVPTITICPRELPTSRATEKIKDILHKDDSCLDRDNDHNSEADRDNADTDADIATNALSDSEADSEDAGADGAPLSAAGPTLNAAALGEQAVARTLMSCAKWVRTFSDLGEYLKQQVTPDIWCSATASAEALLSDTRRAAGALAEVASGPGRECIYADT
ncbi:hypothetical protein B0H10DRAFT_1959950 [Mycena sp. CBHHK59/15]|nr:hypothetical protein B0H10DRAFT_1959950 [Mycena sp. CBHHK59/15]